MLVEETLFGRRDKVQIAIDRLRTFEPPEGYYLAFSGGKDSQAVYHLCREAGVKFDAHYSLTTGRRSSILCGSIILTLLWSVPVSPCGI